jgi:hypothetical protein
MHAAQLEFPLVLVIYGHNRCHAKLQRVESTSSDVRHPFLLGMRIAISRWNQK